MINMKYFVTSDLHFGHDKILDYCKRPFKTVSEMDSKLILNWNKVVGKNDTIFHIGDFCFKSKTAHEEYASNLNGNIIFIKGNHDDVNLTRIENLHFNYGGITMFMTHDPALAFISPAREIICGHVHNLFTEIKQKKSHKHIINAGTDVWDFKPVKIDTLIKMFNKK